MNFPEIKNINILDLIILPFIFVLGIYLIFQMVVGMYEKIVKIYKEIKFLRENK